MDPPRNSELIDTKNNMNDDEIDYEYEYNKLMIENENIKGKIVIFERNINAPINNVTNIEKIQNSVKRLEDKIDDIKLRVILTDLMICAAIYYIFS